MGMMVWLGMLLDTLFTQVNNHLSSQLDFTLPWSHSSTADCHPAVEPISHCDIMSKHLAAETIYGLLTLLPKNNAA